MGYSYDTPTGDVYGFFALAFIVSAVGLARKRPNFYKSYLWELTISGGYIMAIYLWPAFICFRAAFDNDIKTTEWTIWKRFYVAQGAVASLMTFLLGIPLLIKISLRGNKTIQLWYLDDDLRDRWLSWTGENFEEEKENDMPLNTTKHNGFERAIIHHSRYPNLHGFFLFYFFFRYVFSPYIYVPGITITNCVILAVFYRPHYHFTEILFLVCFSTALVLFTWALIAIGGLCWAIPMAFHVWYSVQLCYFVADSSLLVDLQLGFFAIYLSTIYDLISSGRTTHYCVWEWWLYQVFLWNHRSDEFHEKAALCPR